MSILMTPGLKSWVEVQTTSVFRLSEGFTEWSTNIDVWGEWGKCNGYGFIMVLFQPSPAHMVIMPGAVHSCIIATPYIVLHLPSQLQMK